ncbi:MAG: NPXTG-anchored protein [Ruminococcaceae bacterium]|nr:NPXTG-anchored protein [Oscillospiraceae bacterium]
MEINISNVPSSGVEAVADGKSTMQISLAHNGSFGFETKIIISVAPANNGKAANLLFNNGAFEFVASVTVSNGEAALPFSHASEYVIIFAEKSTGTSNNSAVPETNTNPGTGAAGAGAFAALAVVSAAAVIVSRKNKYN